MGRPNTHINTPEKSLSLSLSLNFIAYYDRWDYIKKFYIIEGLLWGPLAELADLATVLWRRRPNVFLSHAFITDSITDALMKRKYYGISSGSGPSIQTPCAQQFVEEKPLLLLSSERRLRTWDHPSILEPENSSRFAFSQPFSLWR